jgi:hypothetical protein
VAEAACHNQILRGRSSLGVQAGRCAQYVHPPPYPLPLELRSGAQTTSPLVVGGGSAPRVVVEVDAGRFERPPPADDLRRWWLLLGERLWCDVASTG